MNQWHDRFGTVVRPCSLLNEAPNLIQATVSQQNYTDSNYIQMSVLNAHRLLLSIHDDRNR